MRKIKFNTTDYDLDLNKRGVYEIKCIINNKRYIGSTSTTFRERWGYHKQALLNNNHSNFKLQYDWNYYNKNNFIFNILKICNSDNSDYIKDIEQYFINLYNSDELYNICKNSTSTLGIKQVDKQILEKSKRYIFVDPYNNIYDIINMRDFCRNNNLPQSHMVNIANKKSPRHYKGWIAYHYDDFSELKLLYDREQMRKKEYIVNNINTGEFYIIDNIAKFARENKLDSSSLSHLLNDKNPNTQHKGFTIKRFNRTKVISFDYSELVKKID